jgi:[ribosomal protein S5]-alanine N-acetyltransferase
MQTTDRLLLRRPTDDDLEALFAIYGDPATNTFNPFGPHASIEQSKSVLDAWLKHWEERGFGQWAIATRATPEEVIGFGGVAFRLYVDQPALNLGYRLATPAWGQGYATEVADAALRHGHDDLGYLKVNAIVRPVNQPSIRVLEKIGMRRVGQLDDVPGQEPSHLYESVR